MPCFFVLLLTAIIPIAACKVIQNNQESDVADIASENYLFYAGLEGANNIFIRGKCASDVLSRDECNLQPKLRSSLSIKKHVAETLKKQIEILESEFAIEKNEKNKASLTKKLVKMKDAASKETLDGFWSLLATGYPVSVNRPVFEITKFGILTKIMTDVFDLSDLLYDQTVSVTYTETYYSTQLQPLKEEFSLNLKTIEENGGFLAFQEGNVVTKDILLSLDKAKKTKLDANIADAVGIRETEMKGFRDICLIMKDPPKNDFSKRSAKYRLNYYKITLCSSDQVDCGAKKLTYSLGLHCFSQRKIFSITHIMDIFINFAKVVQMDRF